MQLLINGFVAKGVDFWSQRNFQVLEEVLGLVFYKDLCGVLKCRD